LSVDTNGSAESWHWHIAHR